jgi:hypothetical protein
MLGRWLDRILSSVLSCLKWLALPISLLLFLQWPLREYVHAYSREANDLGQWLFALYVAASVTAASRAGTHLATDALARHYTAATPGRCAFSSRQPHRSCGPLASSSASPRPATPATF